MNDIEKLLAIEDIKQLKARYFRCLDTKDWEGFKQVYAPDVHCDISEDLPDGIFTNREKIVEAASVAFTGCVSVHHGHCPEIEITSKTSAKGIWAMEDKLRWDEGSVTPLRGLHGYGHYMETYERINGRWHIKTMKLIRMRRDIERR